MRVDFLDPDLCRERLKCIPGAAAFVPNPEDTVEMTEQNPETDRLQRFAEDYTAAWCSQAPARVASFFAEDGSLTINGGEPARGRAAIAASAEGFMTAFPDLTVLLDELSFDGDSVIYHWTLKGTNTGPGGTGRPVWISGREVWTFGEDGLITESTGSFDSDEYNRQLAG